MPPAKSTKDHHQTKDDKLQKQKQEQQPLNNNNEDDDSVETAMGAEVVVPPDGGWGWVVVFASFMCNIIVDGSIYSFGVYLKPISETFEVSEAHVALIGSLMSGFYLMIGPIASIVANRYGFRLVVIIGSVLAAIAFVISYFATSVQFLCISFGVIGGIGFGFIYMPAVVFVGFYFERWRALATGIAVCGSGIGAFLFAPIASTLITNLGWRTALLCLSGTTLCCILFGLLFRPVKPLKIKVLQAKDLDADKESIESRLRMERALQMLDTLSISSYRRDSDVYHTIHVPQHSNDNQRDKRLSIQFTTTDDKIKSDDQRSLIGNLRKSLDATSQNQQQDDVEVVRPLYRDDIFYHGSLTRLPQYQSNTSIIYNIAVSRLPEPSDVAEEKKKRRKFWPRTIIKTLAKVMDFSLLKSPTFLVLAFSGFLTMMGFYVPFMYLADRALINGIDQKTAVFLISAIGIANTVGRVLCGILSSFPGVNALVITNAALTMGGIATICSGLSMEREFQFVYTAIFGLAISCFALRSIIVVDLLGLEKLTNAFGLLLLFQGVAAVIGAPLAGAFKVATGSYDASFYLSGSLILASAILCYPLNHINRWEIKRNQRNLERSAPV